MHKVLQIKRPSYNSQSSARTTLPVSTVTFWDTDLSAAKRPHLPRGQVCSARFHQARSMKWSPTLTARCCLLKTAPPWCWEMDQLRAGMGELLQCGVSASVPPETCNRITGGIRHNLPMLRSYGKDNVGMQDWEHVQQFEAEDWLMFGWVIGKKAPGV